MTWLIKSVEIGVRLNLIFLICFGSIGCVAQKLYKQPDLESKHATIQGFEVTQPKWYGGHTTVYVTEIDDLPLTADENFGHNFFVPIRITTGPHKLNISIDSFGSVFSPRTRLKGKVSFNAKKTKGYQIEYGAFGLSVVDKKTGKTVSGPVKIPDPNSDEALGGLAVGLLDIFLRTR